MRKFLTFLCVVSPFASAHCHENPRVTNIYVFLFYAQSTTAGFNSLNTFIDRHMEAISSGSARVYVMGYGEDVIRANPGLHAEMDYTNAVKRALGNKGVAENNITIQNFKGNYDEALPVVIVRIEVPAKSNRPIPHEPVAETVDTEFVKEQQDASRGAGLYISTNTILLAAATANIGLEWRMSERESVMLGGGWARWKRSYKKHRYYTRLVLPEYRRYLGSQHCWYLGLRGQYGKADVMNRPSGYHGRFYGGSITSGYNLPLGSRLSLDFNLGLGYTMFKRYKYKWMDDMHSGKVIRMITHKNGKRRIIGPNHVGVSLFWRIAQ